MLRPKAPLLEQAEPSKLRFAETLECRRVAGRTGFDGKPGVICMVIVESSVIPSFAKEGWTRPKEKCCEATFERSGRGSCFKLPLIYPVRF